MKKLLTLFSALILLGSMMVVQATDYYYKGNQTGWNDEDAVLMTTSIDGYYAYFSAWGYTHNGNKNNLFKIALTPGGWDYNCSIASPGFNGTNITDMNSSTNSWNDYDWNNAIYNDADFYILVYFPNTIINPSNNPVMCATTNLPNDTEPAEYTVLGEVPGLNWTIASTTNNMTKSGDVYTLLLEDVEMSVKNYDYKIAKNHSWAVAYPQEGNDKLSITTEGVYDVTFTLDLSASPAQSVNAVFKHAAVVIPPIKMTGTFEGGPDWAETAEFTLSANKETASLKLVNLPKGNYEFLVLSGNTYLGNGHTFHRDYTGASGIDSNDGNMVLEADVPGDYTFTWTFEGNALNIDFPECDYYIKNNWYGCDWKWKGMIPGANGTYRIENVVYGGNGVSYNDDNDDTGATWVDYSAIKYADNKVVAAYDTVNLVLNPSTGTITAESINKDVTVYTVAGDELALFAQGWAPSHPYKYTEMKKQTDGTYKWTNMDEEATLCEGPIEFKVIKNKAYANGNWPDGGNYVLNVKRSGNYEIAINFDPCSKAIWVDTTFVKAISIHNFTIKGFGDWSTGRPVKRNTYNDKALVTVPLTASETPYEFKLVDAYDKWYGDGQAFTRENPSIRDIVVPEGAGDHPNMTIKADRTGDYLFTYIFETEQLVVSYPAIVPETKIAPLSGRFTINAQKDSVRFSRGNLQYNYGESVWYTAEKQYEALSDLNLRFGDGNYKGSVDLFDWSCASSQFGLLPSNVNADYTGDFVDWGQKFVGDEKEWSTLSQPEWQYILGRKKNNKPLWTILGIIIAPDTLNGFVLFPDDWTAPAGINITYGYYNWDDETTLKSNAFSLAQWQQMEDAGAVFLPLAGARAGWWGNKVGIDGETLVDEPMNPIANESYCWVDNVDWMGFYWSSTIESGVNVKTPVLPGWHNGAWTAPQYWGRARRYGQAVRLVTRCPNFDYQRDGLTLGRVGTLCIDHNVEAGDIYGGTFYQIAGKTEAGNIVFDEVTSLNAGEPYIYQATASTMGVYYGSTSVASPVPVKGMYGSFEDFNLAIDEGNKLNILYIAGNKIHDCSDIATLQVVANRCYIKLDEVPAASPNAAPGRRRITLGRDEATGLFDLNTSDAPRKLLINGTIYILRGENVYDATGRLVK